MKLLNEGGLGGHILHLYENVTLTFAEIKEILRKASDGKLEGQEKIDGQNIFLSFSVKHQEARAARNKSDLKSGGLSRGMLSQKFSERPNIRDVFLRGFDIFDETVKRMPVAIQSRLFGEDVNRFWNCEVQNSQLTNVINYDDQNLIIHRTGHVDFNPETGDMIKIEDEQEINFLEEALKQYQRERIDGNEQFKIITNAVRTLNGLSNKRALEKALADLREIQMDAGISDSQTIGDYLIVKIDEIVHKMIPDISHKARGKIIRRVIGDDVPMKDIFASLSGADGEKERVREIVSRSKEILDRVIRPIELIIHEFSVEILQGLRSAFILNPGKEVERLKSEVNDAIQTIRNSGNDEAIHVLTKQLEKLKSVNRINSSAEGFTFTYNGRVYKFTGNFAPINQILNLVRYGRGKKIPPLSRLVRTARSLVREGAELKNRGTSIAAFPGKFKPPHAGHLAVAKKLISDDLIDKVLILISPGQIQEGDLIITADKSKEIWELLLGHHPKLEIRISPNSSPVRSTFMLLESMNDGDVLYAVMSSKEQGKDSNRFEKLQEYADKVSPGVETRVIQLGESENISSTLQRQALLSNDQESFNRGLGSIDGSVKQKIWNLIKGVESPLEEMSAGASGGSFGSIFKNPFGRRK